MSGVVRCNLDTAGGVVLPINSKVTVEGYPIGLSGCPVAPHGDDEHRNAVMVGGSSKVTVGGVAVLRGGVDRATCGHVVTGSSKVTIGG